MAQTLAIRIAQKIKEAAPSLNTIPGAVIIVNIPESTVEHMSAWGCSRLNTSVKELKEMGANYHTRFFNPEDAADYVPKILGMLSRNNDEETVSFFQQVRANVEEPWEWYVTSIKIFMRDDEGLPLLCINVATPIDAGHYFITKIERMLQENQTMLKSPQLLSALSKREKQILSLMAQDKTSHAIGRELFISEGTVKTHRRNIKKKVGANNHYEIVQFAQAFNIV